MFCEFALDGGPLQPFLLVEEGAEVEGLELVEKVFKAHPENAVFFVFVLEELHKASVHQRRRVAEVP